MGSHGGGGSGGRGGGACSAFPAQQRGKSGGGLVLVQFCWCTLGNGIPSLSQGDCSHQARVIVQAATV